MISRRHIEADHEEKLRQLSQTLIAREIDGETFRSRKKAITRAFENRLASGNRPPFARLETWGGVGLVVAVIALIGLGAQQINPAWGAGVGATGLVTFLCAHGARHRQLRGLVRDLTSPGGAALLLDRALFEGGVQERAICILGVEFKNLKALKTASEPMRVAEVLIAVEQFLAGEIAKAGGHLERFDDDLTMAFLGSPLDTRGEHLTVSEMGLRGVTLAKTILSQLKERHQLFESNSPVHMGIGVHVATIVMGWARLEGHVSWVAQGEGVELTRELARATEWDEILVGDAVMHASETTYELRRKEPMYSASTQQIVKIHSILDPLVTPVMPRV